MTLHELQRRLSKFNIREEVRTVIEETQDELVKLNQGQLYRGKDSQDKFLKPYSPFYAEYKQSLNHPIASITNRRTLFLTGRWWNALKVAVKSQTFEIYNDDPKHIDIVAREGENILGLSKNSKAVYVQDHFFPQLKFNIQKKLGLNFT